jgi:chitin disaccharide deacetylase
MTKHLIVNADDFGLSPGVNRGIIEATEHGIVTSASLMVRQPAAAAAAAYAKANPRLGVGLHLDFGEWVFRDGDWAPLYTVVATDDVRAVADEVEHQLREFERLIGTPPTHLDSHQHAHRQDPVRAIVLAVANRLGVPLRECSPSVHYCGDFYGQTGQGESLPDALSVEALKAILDTLSDGVVELGCHPGYDDGLATIYRAERALEVRTLCAPAIRDALRDLRIELCSFADVPRQATAVCR